MAPRRQRSFPLGGRYRQVSLYFKSSYSINHVTNCVSVSDVINKSGQVQRCYWLINTLRPRRNEQHFADDIFKRIFFNENVWIAIKISLKFVPKGPIDNITALVEIMAWRRSGDKPLSQPMMISLPTHICVIRPQWVKIYFLFHRENNICANGTL